MNKRILNIVLIPAPNKRSLSIALLTATIALAFSWYWLAPPPGFVLLCILAGSVIPVIHRVIHDSWVDRFLTAGVFYGTCLLRDYYRLAQNWRSYTVIISAFFVGGCFVELCLRPFFPTKEMEQERRLKEAIENPSPTLPSNLPLQFRFITRETTLQEVRDRIGHWSRKIRRGGIVGFEYALPSGYAVLILPEPPYRPESRVRDVRIYFKSEKTLLDWL